MSEAPQVTHFADDATLAHIAKLEAELAAARISISDSETWTDEDRPLPEDEAIKAAHPLKTGDYATWHEAQRMVGAKRSKYALIDLLNWAMVRNRAGSPK